MACRMDTAYKCKLARAFLQESAGTQSNSSGRVPLRTHSDTRNSNAVMDLVHGSLDTRGWG